MSVLNYNENLKPAVTVICITYKHEEYIRQALDSFLMQKTNFFYQIYVGEDKGPDNTADIVREYAEKYPDKIVAFLREDNMGAQRNLIDMCQKANSPYIAFCEGDDYWTDEYKLQKQYDLMEAHPEYRACFAETEILADESWYLNNYYKPYKGVRSIPRSIPGYKRELEMKMDYYIGFGPAHTSSMFFRWNYELEIPDWYYRHIYGDHSIMMLQVGDGLLGYIPEIMSVYRRSDVGVLMNDDLVEHFINTRESWIEMAMDLECYFKEHYKDFAREEIRERIALEFVNYIKYLIKRGENEKIVEVFRKYNYAAMLAMNILLDTQVKYKRIEKSINKDYMPIFYEELPVVKQMIHKNVEKREKRKAKELNAIIKYNKWYAKIRKQDNLWVFSCEGNQFENNSRHLFEYVIANHPEIKAVWLSNNTELEKLFLAENLPFVKADTKEGKRILKKASVIFVNKYINNSCIYKGFNQASKIVRLSFESDYISNEINSEKHQDKSQELLREDVLSEKFEDTSLFVVQNSEAAMKIKEEFELSDEQILICNNSRSSATKTMVCGESNPLVLYKIAERNQIVDAEKIFLYLEENISNINNHARKYGYKMHIHLTERDKKMFGELLYQKTKTYDNLEIVYGDVHTNLSCYSVMITDFDAAAMDFILQNKPVISLCYDVDTALEYKELKGEYTEIISPKMNVYWEDVFNDIEEALFNNDYQKDFRIAACQKLFDDSTLDYYSSEKIIDEVKKLVGM